MGFDTSLLLCMHLLAIIYPKTIKNINDIIPGFLKRDDSGCVCSPQLTAAFGFQVYRFLEPMQNTYYMIH